MKKIISFILPVLLLSVTASGNNIQLSNISTAQVNGNIFVNFNLSWENSWRTASTNNYDGAWVFFKFKDNDGKWKPIRFSGSNILAPAGYTVDISNNGSNTGIGAFIYRSGLGFGNVNLTNIKIGIDPVPGVFDIKGFAIEMVYVPEGSFYAGDSTGIVGKSYQKGATIAPYLVTGLGSTVTIGSGTGLLNGENEQNLSATLTNFPVGFAAFWIMKYELSQGAWRDFLNSLTFSQQIVRFPPNIYPYAAAGTVLTPYLRGRIEIITPAIPSPNSPPAVVGCDFDNDGIYNEPTDGEWLAMSYISWPDAAAYLDWAGLRPMTELEYEKSCRGPLRSVPDEFAWGKSTAATIAYSVINDGLTNEAISNTSSTEGNYEGLSTDSFDTHKNLRGGIFATAYSTRITAGAGYYGAMELSGNVSELCVTTWNIAGRSFTGKQGNGIIDEAGSADENYWPGSNGNTNTAIPNGPNTSGVTGTAGFIIRGGDWRLDNRVSKRNEPVPNAPADHIYGWGIRGVREAN